jgi:hypothetical protein
LQALSKSSTQNTKARITTKAIVTSAADGELAEKMLQKTIKPNAITTDTSQSF